MRQGTRLIFTLFYLVLLFALARFITGQWFYLPSGDASLWFQAGLLMVVLGSFFIEQHFTKPVDVVTNVAAAIITLLALEHRATFLFWGFALWGIVAIGVAAFVSMAIQTFAKSPQALKVGKFLFTLSTFLGSAKRLFSAVLFLAIFSYFQLPSTAALFIFIFWAFVIASEPLGLPGFVDRIIASLTSNEQRVGRIWRIVSKNVFQIELLTDMKLSPDDVLEVTLGSEKIYASPLESFSLTDKKIVNVVGISNSFLQDSELLFSNGSSSVSIVPTAMVPEDLKKTMAFQHRDRVLGFVDDGSDIEQLRFKLLSNVELKKGYLVKVFVNEEPVVYQIVNAITRSESHEGDEDRFVLVVAQQVGRWIGESCRFEAINWVAEPGSSVFAEATSAIPTLAIDGSRQVVGRLPNSEYPIHVEINDIVTHHTAILGITGSGKTFLAYELIRKMIDSGIKVLAFDVSADYARDLADLSPTRFTTSSEVTDFLNNPGQKLAIAEFQPSNTNTLVKATAVSVGLVLAWAKSNLNSQQGESIEAKVCVVFEEAHSLIPEWNSVSVKGDTDEVNKISQAILQGRKYGVGALVITQRTANITKTILNQCNTIFALQAFDQTGLEFLKNYIGEAHANSLSTLLPRQAVLFGKASSSRRPVIVKLNDSVKTEVEPAVPEATS